MGAQTDNTSYSSIPSGGSIGYSSRINDPAFSRYIKNTNRYAGIFSVILAIMSIIGFSIYGETSYEMDNPEAMYIGLIIGGMFLFIGILTILSRKRNKTWNGRVVDKTIIKRRRKQSTGSERSDYYWIDYIEYTVVLREDGGKKHKISVEDDDTRYNYYQIGDRVRHHGKLNSYEKYDKSKDSIIFCNACASLNDMKEEYCFRCKCPLLK